MNKIGVNLENTFPRTIFKKAYAANIIEEEQVWIRLLEDRNATSHIYDEKLADEIAQRIKAQYVQAIGKMVEQVKSYL